MTMVHDYLQYNSHGLLNLATALFDLTLGLLVLFSNPRSAQQRSFFYFSLATAGWLIGYAMINSVQDVEDSILWLRFAFLGVPLIPAVLHLFSERLVEGETKASFFAQLGIVIGWTFATTAVFFTEYLCSMRPTPWGRTNQFLNSTFGLVFFWSLIAYYVIYFGAAYLNFFTGFRNSLSPQTKTQFRSILIAFTIGYAGVLDFTATKGINLYPFGYMAMTAVVSTIAYGIVRSQILDIDMRLKRVSLVALIYVFLLGFSFPGLFPIARTALGDVATSNVFIFLLFSAVFGIIFSTGAFIYAYLERHTFWLKKHVTTGLTHELKSPISSIRGALNFLQDQLGSPETKPQQIADYIGMIDKNTTRLEHYVRDLLNVAKSQEGVPTIQRSEGDLVLLAKQVTDSYQPQLQARDLSLTFQAPPTLHANVDKEKIKQVLSNLLSNAIKFSESEEITVQLRNECDHHVISVKDSGRGIPKKDLERVFDRFYQGQESTQGSGIGLTIAKAWVEAHGGKIWAESDGEGKGATVMFTLPVG